MALSSIGSGGIGSHSTSATSFTISNTALSINASDNHFAILAITVDNNATVDGDNGEITSVTGGTGTWSKLGEYTNSNGAAAAGVTVACWLFKPSGNNATSTTFTINLGNAVVDKCASLWVFSHGAGNTVQLDPETTPQTAQVDAASGYGSCAFSGLTSQERLYFHSLGKEANVTGQITPTTNYTAIAAVRSRNNAAAVITRGQFRIFTGTSTTSNPTHVASGDAAGVLVALEELVPTTVSITAVTGAYAGQVTGVNAKTNVSVTALTGSYSPQVVDVAAGSSTTISITPASAAYSPQIVLRSLRLPVTTLTATYLPQNMTVNAQQNVVVTTLIGNYSAQPVNVNARTNASVAAYAGLYTPQSLAVSSDTTIVISPAAGTYDNVSVPVSATVVVVNRTLLEQLHQVLRDKTLTLESFGGDIQAYADLQSLPPGQVSERLLSYVQTITPTNEHAGSALNALLRQETPIV